MDSPLLDGLGVCALLAFGAMLTLAQTAVSSLREGQLAAFADRGPRGRRVIALAGNPERLSHTVRIGTVFTAVAAAALGAATLAEDVAPALRDAGLNSRGSDAAATAIVAVVVAYLALTLAELVPFRLAAPRAEWYALALAGTVHRFAILVAPIRWLLRTTARRRPAPGGDPAPTHDAISSEELREMVTTHAELSADERRLMGEVFAVGDVVLREVMVPRTEVDFIDAATPLPDAARFALSRPHSRYPVIRGSADDVAGFVNIRDLLDPALRGRTVGEVAREVPAFPATNRVLPVLGQLRAARARLAVVVDEYGGTAGIVTIEDLVEELVGELHDEFDPPAEVGADLAAGAMEVDGLLNLEDFADTTGLALADGPYETVAGFVVAELGHIAEIGEGVAVNGHRLEVTALDGRRVARVRVTPAPAPEAVDAAASTGPGTGGPGRPE